MARLPRLTRGKISNLLQRDQLCCRPWPWPWQAIFQERYYHRSPQLRQAMRTDTPLSLPICTHEFGNRITVICSRFRKNG